MFRNIAGIFRNIVKTAFRNTGLAVGGLNGVLDALQGR